MVDIYEELKTLRKGETSFFGFMQKKTQDLSRLKLNFYDKMKKLEYDEDNQKAHSYLNYLLRTVNLSVEIYSNMSNNLRIVLSQIDPNALKVENTNEFGEFDPGNEFLTLKKNLVRYIGFIKSFTNDILFNRERGNIVLEIRQLALNQLNDIKKMENEPHTLFQDLEFQKDFHRLLLKEEELSKILIQKIKLLEKETISFVGQLKKQVEKVKGVFKYIVAELTKKRQLQNPIKPLMAASYGLEKHASLFAATIFGLTIVEIIAIFYGFETIHPVCKTGILWLAKIGEPLQAIPAMKKGYLKFQSSVKSAANRAMGLIPKTA